MDKSVLAHILDRCREVNQDLLQLEAAVPLFIAKWLALYFPDARVRKKYAYAWGVRLDEGSYANLGLKVVPNSNELCVYIGKHVSIAPNVTFICDSAPNNSSEMQALPYVREHLINAADIIVKDHAWIGANVTIMPGVTIGDHSVIGAGSIVFSNVEPYSVYAGTPARKIRNLLTGERVT